MDHFDTNTGDNIPTQLAPENLEARSARIAHFVFATNINHGRPKQPKMFSR